RTKKKILASNAPYKYFNIKTVIKKLTSLLFVALLVIGCGGKEEASSSRGQGGWSQFARGGGSFGRVTSVETKAVNRTLIADQVRAYGTVRAQDIVAITPQVSNRITKLYVDLGDEVRRGQLVAKIFDATFKDQRIQAQAQVQQSKINVQRDSTQLIRQEQLLDAGAISQSEYDIALSNYQTSLAQLETSNASLTQAQENYDNTEVRSPVNGVVTIRNLAEGDIATAGQAIFEIANTTGYESRIFLPVQDWREIRVGQEVNLRVSSEENPTAKGIISRKSPQLDATTGLGEVVVTLTELGSSIYPGVLTENVIDITVKPQAITVPRSALVEKVETVIEPESNTIQLDRTYSVFVAVGDSSAELRKLTLGIEQGDKIEVVSGLRSGENIIVTGQTGLRDGARIRVSTGSAFTAPQRGEIAQGDSSASGQGQRGGWEARAQQGGQRPGGGGGMRAAFQNMSDEERAKIRQRMQSMTQDERRAFMDSLRTASNTPTN
ncbi:MAG: efflux RND transporter periplasmic adaptor subunit, partial [Bacteroidota bacterium]